MRKHNLLCVFVLAILGPALTLGAQSPALEIIPGDAHAYIYIPSMSKLAKSLVAMSQKTGLETQFAPETIADAIRSRTGVGEGIDMNGPVLVAFLDPKLFEGRSTIYVQKAKDFDKLLLAHAGQEIDEEMYVLTGVEGARFAYLQNGHVLLTNSLRTLQAVRAAKADAHTQLGKDAKALLSKSDVFINVNLSALLKARHKEMTLFYRAAAGDIFTQPELSAYAPMLVGMLAGLADVIDQAEGLAIGIQLLDNGIRIEAVLEFADGSSVAKFTAAQGKAATTDAFTNLAGDVPFAAASSISFSAKTLREEGHNAVAFFLDSAPRPEPRSEDLKAQVLKAVDMLLGSLQGEFTFMSAPGRQGMGSQASVTIIRLRDAEAFTKSVPLLIAAWQQLAKQMSVPRDPNLLSASLDIRTTKGAEKYHGVSIDIIEPRMSFGLPPRDTSFRKQLSLLYGPDGFRYRLAVVGNSAVLTVGSDLRLFHAVIDNIAGGKKGLAAKGKVTAALKNLGGRHNFVTVASLPMYLAESIRRSGSGKGGEVTLGTVDAGNTLAGASALCEGRRIKFTAFVPHEQIGLSYDLLKSLLKSPEDKSEAKEEKPEAETPPAKEPETAPPEPAPSEE
ncbi:MAG: hypothetical protein QGD94_08535 [Planctomycetia bacterium]|nr:hypothetical protein [Planctomycetia bacterium]